jgi:predicted short-subunit dehydrogenase-like oxidoreductase (DUF2520 family)
VAPSDSSLAIVGAGRIARAIGRLLHTRGGLKVVGVASRSADNARSAASFIGDGVMAVELADVGRLSPRVLIAVADRALPTVASDLVPGFKDRRNTLALHTCGVAGPEAITPLRDAGVACGVFHPLQTVTSADQGVNALVGVTFGIAGDPPALEWARTLAGRLEGQVLELDPSQLATYHAAAVMASNALVGVVDAAVSLMVEAGVDPQRAMYALGPLAFTALENALSMGPADALTGPVSRGDHTTVAAHLGAMREMAPSVRALYVAAARHLLDLAKARGLAAASIEAVENELR